MTQKNFFSVSLTIRLFSRLEFRNETKIFRGPIISFGFDNTFGGVDYSDLEVFYGMNYGDKSGFDSFYGDGFQDGGITIIIFTTLII